MRKILSYIPTFLFHLYFSLLLGLFHIVQEVCRIVFGDKARKKSVDVLNFLFIKGFYMLGCRPKFSGFENIPDNRPVIIVSNHQSMYDIPAVIWGFRKYYPRFIAKMELGRNVPSISINLKHGKSALIDRKNGSQSIKEILKLGKLIEANKQAACIFPEGTRSKTGELRKFMSAGVGTLLRAAPSAVIVPFAIYGHAQLISKGMWSLQLGQKIRYTALEPIEPKGRDLEELVLEIRSKIQQQLDTEK